MKAAFRFAFFAATSALAAGVYACGSDSNVDIPGGNGADAASESGNGNSNDSGNVNPGDGAADAGQDAAVTVPCDPPSDNTKAALCLQVDHEAIDFLPNDPRLDGLGFIVAQVFPDAVPDFPDGGEEPALGTAVLPQNDAGAADAGAFDLHNPIPVLRFEIAPGTVYPRVFFVDSSTATLGAGWWVAGLDFSNGIYDKMPLGPQTLVAGKGTGVKMTLTALRALVVNVTRSVDPTGDGQGVTTVLALNDNKFSTTTHGFGIAQGCTNLSADDAGVNVNGFVIGKGPYYLSTGMDDFGVGNDGGGAGYLVSVTSDGGSFVIPEADKAVYAPTAYVVAHAVDLNVALPKPNGADKTSCP